MPTLGRTDDVINVAGHRLSTGSMEAVLAAHPAVAAVREQIGAVAALRDVRAVDALPKTRSGRILRRTMRNIADGADEPVPSIIEDAGILNWLHDTLVRPHS